MVQFRLRQPERVYGVPVILGMYERGYRGYRQSLETHWHAYLDGKVSREAAIRQILIETAPQKK